MNVVNQMLNQLEQRGVSTAPEQTMVRPVPHGKRSTAISSVLVVIWTGVVLVSGVAVWQWVQVREPVLNLSKQPAPISAKGAEIVAARTVQLPPVMAAHTPASAVPAVVSGNNAVSAGKAPAAEKFLPSSRLSFELNPALLRATEKSSAASRSETHPAAALPTQPVKPQPIQAASSGEQENVRPTENMLPVKKISPAQRADAEFRKAVALMQQGRIADALAGYEAALRLDASHDAARQALVALLLENKRGADAERVLQDGLNNKPAHTGFAMLLARVQVERGAVGEALATLEKVLPHAATQVDYQAFIATLLQRQNRHKEAIAHYQTALQLAPGNGALLMGYGISLQAEQRTEEARNAFKRALEAKTLNPELQEFVQRSLKGL